MRASMGAPSQIVRGHAPGRSDWRGRAWLQARNIDANAEKRRLTAQLAAALERQ